MPSIDVPVRNGGFGQTSRRDNWWLAPLLTFIGLGAFVLYANVRVFQGDHYHFGPYLSPFYSPEIVGPSPHAWFQVAARPAWWPGFLPFSAALLVMWAPVGFRMTCYYYRGAYYKAFWADPPNCSVGEPRKSYWGERSWPLVIQNIHRYFLYFALIFIGILAHDAWKAYWFADGFHVNVGSLVMTLNPILLGGYTLGCHSFRHLIGGGMDEISKSPSRAAAYDCVTCLNKKHMVWAWCSLVWVAFSDVYLVLCSTGVWQDRRIF
ncbi:MAG: succinate dehydrogenase [Acidobacteria bacterium]|nr:succinate dehydrogenase [Acidobacteriota bacterium]